MQSGTEVLPGSVTFLCCRTQLRIRLKRSLTTAGIAKGAVNTAIFQVDNRILVAVVSHGFDLRMFYPGIFLMRGAIFLRCLLYADR